MGPTAWARRSWAFGVALAVGTLFSPLFATSASADLEFCPTGSAAGQCAPPANLSAQRGLSLDYETGHLYAADQADNRVNVFEEDGDFLFAFGWGVDTGAPELQTCTEASGCQAGLAGSGAGQMGKPPKVAVDNDPASPNHHFVYVVDAENSRVELFDPTSLPVKFVRSVGSEGSTEGKFESPISIGVGPSGVLHALDNVAGKHRLQRFKANGELNPPQCLLFEGGRAISLAVDGAGNFWVANAFLNRGIRKYSSACALLFLAEGSDEIENTDVAVDEGGNPFATQNESFRVITAYDQTTGKLVRRFAYGKMLLQPEGLAPHLGGEGGIFVSVREPSFFVKRLNFVGPPPTLPSPGPLPAQPSTEAKELGSVKAKLVAKVNPEGKASEVHFEYLAQAEWEAQGESFAGPATKATPTVPLGASDFTLKTTEAQIGCTDPASEAGEPDSKCLTPQTTYRWRIIATNADNPTGKDESTVEGIPFETLKAPSFGDVYATKVGTNAARLNAEINPTAVPTAGWFEYVDDAAFQTSGFAQALKAPTGAPLDFGSGDTSVTRRATISPLEPATVYHYRIVADNPLIEPLAGPSGELRTFAAPEAESCPNQASRIGPGAFLPDCRAYEMVSPPDKEGGDIRVGETTFAAPAVLEQSATSGEKLAYGSFRAFGDAQSAPFTSQYIARRIKGKEWEAHSINPQRGRPVFPTIGQLDTEFRAFSADLCEAWQKTFAEPPLAPGALAEHSNLYRREDELCTNDETAHYEALSPDVEWLSGVSEEGGHAIFLSRAGLTAEGTKGVFQLYEHVRGEGVRFVCVLPNDEAVSGSCTAGSATAGENPATQSGRISDEGQRIFWSAPGAGEGKLYVRIDGTQTIPVSKGGEETSGTSKSWFWGASSEGSKAIFSTEVDPGASDLYEFDVDSEQTTPIATGVIGVLGVSEDASRAYFASSKVLSGEESNSNGDKAVAGQANLYLHEAGGDIRFVGTLASADLVEAISVEPYWKRTSRLTPDGAHATFVSVAPLTGYDNKGAESGAPTTEVYRYDANASELTCVSCNPSGARPAGRSKIPFWQTGTHAARVLSDDGARLYFESADPLAARDSNGRTDVYQWEEEGAGGCEEADASFSSASGGCVDLVSSGQGPQDSRFVEASPAADDVFFATVAGLLPQDPGSVDVYDARVGGGLPIPPPPRPECEGDACHHQVPAPAKPTPASSTYIAPPEEAAQPKPRCPKGKRRISHKGKAHCVRRHKQRKAR